jgi:hypothetical protein
VQAGFEVSIPFDLSSAIEERIGRLDPVLSGAFQNLEISLICNPSGISHELKDWVFRILEHPFPVLLYHLPIFDGIH